MRRLFVLTALLLLALTASRPLRAQADDDTMSQKEIESLRDTAYIPKDRIVAFEKILNTREQEIQELLAQPHRVSFSQDMHDSIDQFGAVADEFNDNLDDYSSKHRDVRKALPKLLSDIERWSTTLRAPADDDSYNIVRRIALNSLKDMRDSATRMQTEQTAYFKAHPDAAKLEKERADPNHAPVPDEDSR
jgi:hypothetical protein